MFINPRWLRVSIEADYSIFEIKDLDESVSEIFQIYNGNLTDDNFSEVPYEAVAWHGWVREQSGTAPSWSGHIHDGISAKRFACGYIGKQDVPYDGSLGVLLSPEDDRTASYNRERCYDISENAAGDNHIHRGLYGFCPVYLITGKFGFAPSGGGAAPFDATYRTDDIAYVRQPVAAVPFDISELKGPLIEPVCVATLRAEMQSDTFPERSMPGRDTAVVEERYWGMGIRDIHLFPITGQKTLGGSEDCLEGYALIFSLVLPGPDHVISKGVSRWWVDWMLLVRVAEGVPLYTAAGGGGDEGS